MAKRGTELRTDFTGDDAKFQRTVTKQIGNAKKFGAAWEQAGARAKRTTAAIGSSLRAVGGILVGAAAIGGVKSLAKEMDRIGKLSQRFGIGVETLQGMGHAAELAGSDMEEVARAMVRANKSGQDAANGLTTATRAFEALGINVVKFNRLDQKGQFLAIANAVAKSSNANRTNAAVLDVMGRSAANLIPLLQQGSAEILAQADAIHKATEQEVRDIQRLNDQLTTVGTNFKRNVGLPILNFLSDVGGGLQILADVAGGMGLHEAQEKATKASMGTSRNRLLTPAERAAEGGAEGPAGAAGAAISRSRSVTGSRAFDIRAGGGTRITGGAGAFDRKFSGLDKLAEAPRRKTRRRQTRGNNGADDAAPEQHRCTNCKTTCRHPPTQAPPRRTGPTRRNPRDHRRRAGVLRDPLRVRGGRKAKISSPRGRGGRPAQIRRLPTCCSRSRRRSRWGRAGGVFQRSDSRARTPMRNLEPPTTP